MSQEQSLHEALTRVGQKNLDKGVATVETTEDKLKLFLSIEVVPPSTPIAMTVAELTRLVQELAPGSVPDHVVLDNVRKHLASGEAVQQRRVAKGEAPTPGRDGKVVLLVKPYDPSKQHDHTIDEKFLRSFDNVEKGSVVARIIAPSLGSAGTDVFGKQIAAPLGAPAELAVDDTVKRQVQDGIESVITEVPGYVSFENHVLRVCKELVIDGGVNFRTGSIDFIGSVLVKGDVLRDLTVTAREDIVVQGNVVHAHLFSRRGNITVQGYVSGDAGSGIVIGEHASDQMLRAIESNKKAQIVAGGMVQAMILDGATVESHGDILVEKEARNSNLRTRARAMAPRGRIYGGEVFAVCGVEAAEIGNSAGARTVIHACSDLESSAEYAELSDKIHSHQTAEDLLSQQLGPFINDPKRLAGLTADYRKKIDDLHKKLVLVQGSKAELIKQREHLLATARRNEYFAVNIVQKIFGGVVILAGNQEMKMTEEIAGPKTLKHDPEKAEFSIGPLRPLECSVAKEFLEQKP